MADAVDLGSPLGLWSVPIEYRRGTGFCFVPTIEAASEGWGLPYTPANKPWGTPNGDLPFCILSPLSKKSVTPQKYALRRGFGFKKDGQHQNPRFGNLDWVWRDKKGHFKGYLTWYGSPGRNVEITVGPETVYFHPNTNNAPEPPPTAFWDRYPFSLGDDLRFTTPTDFNPPAGKPVRWGDPLAFYDQGIYTQGKLLHFAAGYVMGAAIKTVAEKDAKGKPVDRDYIVYVQRSVLGGRATLALYSKRLGAPEGTAPTLRYTLQHREIEPGVFSPEYETYLPGSCGMIAFNQSASAAAGILVRTGTDGFTRHVVRLTIAEDWTVHESTAPARQTLANTGDMFAYQHAYREVIGVDYVQDVEKTASIVVTESGSTAFTPLHGYDGTGDPGITLTIYSGGGAGSGSAALEMGGQTLALGSYQFSASSVKIAADPEFPDDVSRWGFDNSVTATQTASGIFHLDLRYGHVGYLTTTLGLLDLAHMTVSTDLHVAGQHHPLDRNVPGTYVSPMSGTKGLGGHGGGQAGTSPYAGGGYRAAQVLSIMREGSGVGGHAGSAFSGTLMLGSVHIDHEGRILYYLPSGKSYPEYLSGTPEDDPDGDGDVYVAWTYKFRGGITGADLRQVLGLSQKDLMLRKIGLV